MGGMIDITFKTYSDAGGGDPDATSKTLKAYHKLLWSKALPSGVHFELRDDQPKAYLYHQSSVGTFFLGSDSITHSYRRQARKQDLIRQVSREADELFEIGSTIGAYLIFPNRVVDGKPTINQARGVHALVDDRFDLTLECIRRHYSGDSSPLGATLQRYSAFFDLFVDFDGYVDFFLLNDLVAPGQAVRFYLPFDGFRSSPVFRGVRDYLDYKDGVSAFVGARNQRMKRYVEGLGR